MRVGISSECVRGGLMVVGVVAEVVVVGVVVVG